MADHSVKVFIYDISKGLARTMSMAFLGKQIDGVWHTGVVVYGEEYYFGGGGIESCPPRGTLLGSPDTIHDLGTTQVPKEVFLDYLRELSSTTFRPDCYHLLQHNCNTFSSEVSQFLTGKDIPKHITNLPAEVLSTPFGQMLKPFVDSMSVSPEGGHTLFDQGCASKQNKGAPPGIPTAKASDSASKSTPSNTKPSKQNTDIKREPVTFPLHLAKIFGDDQAGRSQLLSDLPSEGEILTEVADYLSNTNCTWSLGTQHIQTLGAVLLNSNCTEKTHRVAGSLMQLATLKTDVITVIAHDPNHTISKVLHSAASLPQELLQIVTKMVGNCCSTVPGHTLLTSKAPVTLDNERKSNLKLTTALSVACLLNEQPECWNIGAALVTNLLIYGVDEDTAVELSSAVLQCLTKELSENTANLLLWNIVRLMNKSAEVRALSCVMEVDWSRFSSLSIQCRDLTQDAKSLMST